MTLLHRHPKAIFCWVISACNSSVELPVTKGFTLTTGKIRFWASVSSVQAPGRLADLRCLDLRFYHMEGLDGQVQQTGKRNQVARDLGIQVSMLRRWQIVSPEQYEQHYQYQLTNCA